MTEKFAVTFTAGSNGSISATVDGAAIASGAQVEKNKTVIFTAAPNAGYRVNAWTGATEEAGYINRASLAVNADATVSVSFILIPPKFVVTFNAGANGSISATVDGAAIASGAQVEKNKTVIFTATPNAGYKVQAWTGATQETGNPNKATLNVTSAVSVNVSFTTILVPRIITFNAGTNGGISATVDGAAISSGNSVEQGKTVVFTAAPNAGYRVNAWTGATPNASEPTKASLVVTADATVSVSFKANDLAVNTTAYTKAVGDPAFIYRIVTAGSGSYTISAQNPSVISATISTIASDPNGAANATVTFIGGGSSYLTITDTVSGQSKNSGVFTVSGAPSTTVADFDVAGIRYHVIDSANRYVEIVAKADGLAYTGAMHIPASVTHNGISYAVTRLADNFFNPPAGYVEIAEITAFTVDAASSHLSAEVGVLFSKDKKILFKYPNINASSYTVPAGVERIQNYAFRIRDFSFSLTSITLPAGLQEIGNSVFTDLSNLASINVPSTLTKFGEFAFMNTKLTAVSIPQDTTSIPSGLFFNVASLQTVVLPSTLTEIQSQAFAYCSALTSFTCKAATPPAIQTDTFSGTPIASATLYVPAASVAAYQAAAVWKDFGSIQALP